MSHIQHTGELHIGFLFNQTPQIYTSSCNSSPWWEEKAFQTPLFRVFQTPWRGSTDKNMELLINGDKGFVRLRELPIPFRTTCEIRWWLKIAKIVISGFINSFNKHLKFLMISRTLSHSVMYQPLRESSDGGQWVSEGSFALPGANEVYLKEGNNIS